MAQSVTEEEAATLILGGYEKRREGVSSEWGAVQERTEARN